jgi:hypothetical protein
MFAHPVFAKAEFLAWSRDFHAPLIALAAALVLALAGRFLRAGWLAAAAGGAGVAAGWYLLAPHPFAFPPRPLIERLPLLAAAVLLVALAALRLTPTRRAGVWVVLLALACGWWLAGAPLTRSEALAVWPVALGVAAAVGVTGWLGALRQADPLRPLLAAATLAGALHVAGAPAAWTNLALVPAAAALGLLAAPRLPGLALLPPAVDVGALAAVAALALGRIRSGGLRAIDVAALAPVVALLVAGALTPRLRGTGRLAPVLGCVLAGAIAVGLAWVAPRLIGR